jgi:DNA-binding winged helix-turn-helix (wHTH) protein/Tol biopolymer transport system component
MLLAKNNYKLSVLTLDVATQRLTLSRDILVQLKPQSFQLLYYFCCNQHKIVSREELITHVWHNRIVSDNAINRAVSQLRLAIAQLDPELEYIQTLPRAGYRLCVTVTKITIAHRLPTEDDTSINAHLSAPISANHLPVHESGHEQTQNIETFNSIPEVISYRDTAKPQNKNATIRVSLIVLLMLVCSVLIAQFIPQLLNNDSPQSLLTSKAYTYAPGSEYDASVTRDWLVYVNRNEDEFKVIASNKHNGKQRVVHKGVDRIRFPKLSPNIDLMSVLVRKNERLGLKDCQLNIIHFHSTELIKQYPCGLANVVNQRWLTSSLLQIVTATEDNGLKMIQLDLNSQEQQPEVSVSFADESLRYISIQFSPNGQEVALLSRNMDSSQTYLTLFSSSSLTPLRRIILPSAQISAVQWLENGDFIWLESGRLTVTDSEGNNPIEIMTDLKDITQLNTVYGTELFVSHGHTRTNLISIGSNGKEASQAVSSRDEFMPGFSHNSTQFVFFSNRTGRNELWLSHGRDIKRLSLPEQELLLQPLHWSPDDSRILIPTKSSILVYSLADDSLLTINKSAFQQLAWVNNHELAMLSDSKANELIIYDPLIGTERYISLPIDIVNFQIVDGLLYFSQKDSNDIGQYNLGTQQLRNLGVNANTALEMWQIKQGFLYYVPIGEEKLHIGKRDLETATEQAIYYFNIADAPVFSVSSSGQILVQRQVHDETDVSSIQMH